MNEKIASRIKKLLSLSQSDNLNEAQMAMEKARALMAEYAISKEALEMLDPDDRDIGYEEIILTKKRDGYEQSLWFRIAKVFDGSAVRTARINIPTKMTIFGTKSARETIKVMGDYTFGVIDRLVENKKKKIPQDIKIIMGVANLNNYLKEFRIGVMSGLAKKLWEIELDLRKPHRDEGIQALILNKKSQIEDKIAEVFPQGLRNSKRALKLAKNHLAQNAGIQAASGVSFNKQTRSGGFKQLT